MRAFAWFLAALLFTGLLVGAIAFPAYVLSSSLAAWPFHRVVSRIAMLVLAVSLVGVARHLQVRSKRDLGYGLPWRRFLKLCLWWGIIGAASAGVGAAWLLLWQLRVGAPDFIATPVSLARIACVALLSGISVALLEETVFRGLMHTAIEREAGAWTAALLTASLFAVLHFFAKVRIPADQVGWGSGFDLLLRSFAPLGSPALVADTFLSWLLVGLILSLTRALTGNIAVAIGLHAGWVMVLRLLQESTVSGSAAAGSVWVGRFDGLLGYWMLPWGAGLAAALWLSRARWVPAARWVPPARAG